MYAVARDCAILNDPVRCEYLGVPRWIREQWRLCRIAVIPFSRSLPWSSLSLTWSSRRSRPLLPPATPCCRQLLLFGCPLSISRPTTIEPHYSLYWSFTHALVTSSSHAVPLTSEILLSLSSRSSSPVCTKQHRDTSALAPASSLFQPRLQRGTRDPLKNPTTTTTTIGTAEPQKQ